MKQASKQKFTLNQPHPFLIKPNKKSCSNPRRSCFLTTTLSTLRSQFSYLANNPFTTSPCSDPSSPTLSSDTYPSSTKIPRSGASEISLALSLYTTSLRLQYSFFGTRNSIGSGTPHHSPALACLSVSPSITAFVSTISRKFLQSALILKLYFQNFISKPKAASKHLSS